MDSNTISLYMLIGSHEPIIKWLKEAGVTNKENATHMLSSAARSNVIGSFIHNSDGISSTSHTIKKVLEAFED